MALIRVGRIVKVKPECKEDYIKYHASVWDGVLEAIKNAGIANYSIFNHGDLLFSYYEIDSNDITKLEQAFKDEASKEWEALMMPMQENIDGQDGFTWKSMEQVFYIE